MSGLVTEQQISPQSTSIINFIPLQKIGEGSFSSVYKVRRITDDRIYALKKIKISALKQKQKQNALNEIRILASLNSQYIIQYREAFFDWKLNLLCIVMEFAGEGDLQKKIEGFRRAGTHIQESEVWKAAYHMIKGVDVLHNMAILHRDIKSANIFIADGVYKLGDLNVSKVQSTCSKLAYTQTGTPYYASPQVWRDEPYDYKSDIWSLGCVLYQMCTYRPPFRGKDLQALYHNVQRGTYEPLPIIYSKQLSHFISNFLKLNPKNRLSSRELLQCKVMQQKCKQLNLKGEKDDLNQQLLKTIKLPNDLRDLRKKLPKSKYSCSIDNTMHQKVIQERKIQNQHNQQINPVKKYSHADYYLQLAKKKRQSQNSNNGKINRVISEGSLNKNPQQYAYSPSRIFRRNQYQGLSNQINITSDRKNNRLVIDQNLRNANQKQKLQSPSDRSQKQLLRKLSQHKQKSQQLQIQSQMKGNQKYHISFEKPKQQRAQQQKTRKLSHQQSAKPTKLIVNHISLLKKLSQPSIHNSLSQRNIEIKKRCFENQQESHLKNQCKNNNQYQTERLIRDNHIMKKNQQLAQIERKVDEKRKQLRKIGSIQRLNGNMKNYQNLSYRPVPLVLHHHVKKSTIHMSNILLKSPTSTQDEPSHMKNCLKQRQKVSSSNQIGSGSTNANSGSLKKLTINPHQKINKVSSTPYMIGLSDAPRMKRILQNLQQAKKLKQRQKDNDKEAQLRYKVLSSRHLHKC